MARDYRMGSLAAQDEYDPRLAAPPDNVAYDEDQQPYRVAGPPLPRGAVPRAYHSSPFDFAPHPDNPLGKFDWSKLYTGEGGTAYTPGFYMATNPAVSGRGGHYYNQFMQKFEGTPEGHAASELRNTGFDRAKALAASQANLDELERFVKEGGKVTPGLLDLRRKQTELLAGDRIVGPRTYEIDVKRPMEDFLPWEREIGDLPVWQQRALGTAGRDFKEQGATVEDLFRAAKADPETAGAIVNRRPMSMLELSKTLAQRDVPGVSYFDKGSRPGAGWVPPEQSRNIVGYSPDWFNFTKKYAVPGGVMGGLAALPNEGAQAKEALPPGTLAAQNDYRPPGADPIMPMPRLPSRGPAAAEDFAAGMFPVKDFSDLLRGRLTEDEARSMAPGAVLGAIAPMAGKVPKPKLGAPGAPGIGHNQPPAPGTQAWRDLTNPSAPYARYAENYPEVGPPEIKLKEVQPFPGAGETYEAKQLTPDAKAFEKARTKIMQEMNKKGFEGYFDPEKRGLVDYTKYPPPNVDTSTIRPVMQKSIDRYKVIDAPETRARLDAAIARGEELGNADRWYYMNQLEKEYINELGPKAGRAAFLDEFAAPMAATTSGQAPGPNLMTAHYLEFLRKRGETAPTQAHQTPTPVGGRYAANNLRDYLNMREGGGYVGLGADQPKMHDFSRSMIGDLRNPVMDEQMTEGMLAGSPNKIIEGARKTAYGQLQDPVRAAAAKRGVLPGNIQDIAWAGFKDEPGKPMIQIINEAIERTHRLTGMARSEIVRRGLVRKEIPLYGAGAVVAGGAMSDLADQKNYGREASQP